MNVSMIGQFVKYKINENFEYFGYFSLYPGKFQNATICLSIHIKSTVTIKLY